jgi:hypothetical protein
MMTIHMSYVAFLQNVKMYAMIGGIVAVITFFIVAAACGWNFSHC